MKWGFMLVLILGITVTLGQDFDDDEDAVTIAEDSESQDSDSNDEQKILNYESPTAEPGKFYFADHFDDYKNFLNKWIISEAKKDDTAEEIAKYDGEWKVQPPEKQILRDDLGLVLKSKAKHAAIASRLTKPFAFNDRSLIVQYEVTMQDGQECGGSYIKLLSDGPETADLIQFNDKTPYTIMFGPDKCGNDIKLHFIFRHVNPVNGSITEKHCRKPKERLEEPFKDKLPHLYQLVVNPDNTFQISVDRRVINEGSLLTDFNPPVNPPKEIDDPEDKKPKNWDEREKIPDPDSKKPEDWDEDAPPQVPDPNAVRPDGWLDEEEEMIPDPTATKPEDWDTEMDGEWEAPLVKNPICEKAVGCGLWKAPLISNPDYKGKWRAPLIENPNYQGKWAPRKVPNPDFFEDLNPFKMTTISAIGIELWSMSSNILFDNLLITDDLDLADQWAAQTFDLKRRHIDKESESFFSKIVKVANENPWLWGVYILIIGVPLTFVLYMLCSSKDKPSAKSKKTDKQTPDDEPPNNTGENPIGEDEILDEDTRKNASPKSKKSDLEVNNDDVNEEVGGDVDVEEIDSEETEEQARSSPTAEIPAPSSITTTTTPTADGARKRKPRKE